MDAVNWAEIVGKIAAGGYPAWIVTGVLGIIALILYIKYRLWANAQAKKASDQQQADDQAKNNTDNQNTSNDWQNAQDNVGQPDDPNKKPRPPEPT